MPSAIILAAGSSTRLGRPKQLIRIANETLIERSIRIAHSADLAPIFVIISPTLALCLGFENSDDKNPGAPSVSSLIANGWDTTNLPSSLPVELLTNHHAAEGMASSIRLGVRASIEAAATGTIVLACDQIAVTPEHLHALTETEVEVRASAYAGRNGIPAYFPAFFFENLLQLTGDTGARDLLRQAASVPLLHGDLDIDTPADLALARILFPDISAAP